MNWLKLALTTLSILVFLNYTKKVDNIILVIDTSLKVWEGVLI